MLNLNENNQIVNFTNLSAGYDKKKPLFDGISLSIEKELIYGINGGNGLGKTTLLKIISQVNKKVAFTKKNLHISDETSLSVAHQDYNNALFQWFTVFRNIGMPLEVTEEFNKETAIEKAKELCSYFEIEFKSDKPLELSGGQKQLVILLRSIISNPKLLLLDEPFSAINNLEEGAKFRMKFLKYLKDRKITTLFVSHSPKELIYFSDKIIFLKLNDDKKSTIISKIETIEKTFNTTSIIKSIVEVDNELDTIYTNLNSLFNND